MSKYIDLAPKIAEDTEVEPIFLAGRYQREVLRWLDEHPDQVPGRTATELQVWAGMKAEGIVLDDAAFEYWKSVLGRFGITVVPDPKPTNAELLAAQIRLTLRENSPDTCKNAQDVVAERIAKDLDKAGVKAPGGR